MGDLRVCRAFFASVLAILGKLDAARHPLKGQTLHTKLAHIARVPDIRGNSNCKIPSSIIIQCFC